MQAHLSVHEPFGAMLGSGVIKFHFKSFGKKLHLNKIEGIQ